MNKQPNLLSNQNFNAIAVEQIFIRIAKCSFLLLLVFAPTLIFGQDLDSGVEAIEEAAEGIEGYFAPIETIVYVVGGIISLLGAVKVYTKWQMGDPDVMSTAAGWFGSAIFLIVAITVIKSFFDIG